MTYKVCLLDNENIKKYLELVSHLILFAEVFIWFVVQVQVVVQVLVLG